MPGKPGLEGIKGVKGAIGHSGENFVCSVPFALIYEPSLLVFYVNSYSGVSCTGQPGRPGEKGVPGLSGPEGQRGFDGRPGKCGQENFLNLPNSVHLPLEI